MISRSKCTTILCSVLFDKKDEMPKALIRLITLCHSQMPGHWVRDREASLSDGVIFGVFSDNVM